MTKPVIRLPGIKVRRQQRRDFKALKARVDASPAMQARRAESRRHVAADRARKKIRAVETGAKIVPRKNGSSPPNTVTPITAAEFAALNADRQHQALRLGLYTAPG